MQMRDRSKTKCLKKSSSTVLTRHKSISNNSRPTKVVKLYTRCQQPSSAPLVFWFFGFQITVTQITDPSRLSALLSCVLIVHCSSVNTTHNDPQGCALLSVNYTPTPQSFKVSMANMAGSSGTTCSREPVSNMLLLPITFLV